MIYIGSKSDIAKVEKCDITISQDDSSLDDLFSLIKKKLNLIDEDKVGFSSKRDIDLLSSFVNTLDEIELDLKEDITIDIVEIKLLDAARKLDELIGVESTLEDVYDTIFKNFCIGK